jgi:hypothetical protein
MAIQVQEAFGTPNSHDQKRPSPQYIIVKLPRMKHLVIYKGKVIRIITETQRARKAWNDVYQELSK